ncbi:MAG TPA: ParB/RepB/Spo0J family partition protein [Oscillospiraceae bacterium]|nr:ParB/RepB/Spo0J family partition protein [Oscillospiraceae bacterium]
MSGLFGGVKEKVLNKVVQIDVEEIVPNPHQPRRCFDDNELEFLAESIKQNGILQPLTVRRSNNTYELISGERRLRASKIAGLSSVPCIIIDVTERNSAVLALVENIQRQDLSFFDEAYAIEKLIDFYGMTQEDAAIRLGKAQSTIANKLRLLRLSEAEMQLINDGNLTERHARALLKVIDKDLRLNVIERIIKFNLNVERTEALIEQLLETQKDRESLKRRSGAFKDVRLFVNTINKAIETMRAAGINADSTKSESNGYIEYVVRIPVEKKAAQA